MNPTAKHAEIKAGVIAITNSTVLDEDSGKMVRVEAMAPAGEMVLDGRLFEDIPPGAWIVAALGIDLTDQVDGSPVQRGIYMASSLIPIGGTVRLSSITKREVAGAS